MPPGISSSTVFEPSAVLLHHHQLLVGREGDDIDPVDTFEDVKIVFLAGARREADVRAQLEDAEITDEF